MKRTGFKNKPPARSGEFTASVSKAPDVSDTPRVVAGNTVLGEAREPIMKTGRSSALPAPNKVERAFHTALRELGCVVCLRKGLGWHPVEVHHLMDGQRRRGHMVAIGLCPNHHQHGTADEPSRHGSRGGVQVFEAAYGLETELLAWTLERIKIDWRSAA